MQYGYRDLLYDMYDMTQLLPLSEQAGGAMYTRISQSLVHQTSHLKRETCKSQARYSREHKL